MAAQTGQRSENQIWKGFLAKLSGTAQIGNRVATSHASIFGAHLSMSALAILFQQKYSGNFRIADNAE
jgi:hypothetical protein